MIGAMEPIGRESELAAIDAARVAAESGTARFVVVVGEAGIGKSSLIAAASDRARAAGWRVLVGGCLDIGDGGLPYLPMAEILRGLARTTTPAELAAYLGPGRAELARIAPDLEAETRVATGNEPQPGSITAAEPSQALQFERMLQLLGRLAATAPTMLVVEDVQWLDRATRDLLTFLGRNLSTEPLLIVLTARSDALPAGHPLLVWLADLARSASSTRIELDGLDREAIARQLVALGGTRPEPEVLDRIWRRSDGNPMFVEELVAASEAGTGSGRSATLEQLLLGRLGGLSETSRAVLAAVAVAGRPVDDELVMRVLDAPSREVAVALRQGIERGVLAVDASAGLFRIRHELLREAIEGETLPGERRRLHERFATILPSSDTATADGRAAAAAELAYHWRAAGHPVEAHAAALVAAAEAEAVHAHADAYRQYRQAIDLEPSLPDDQRPSAAAARTTRRLAAEVADLAGEFRGAIELVRGLIAEGDADPDTDPTELGLLHSRLGYLLWAAGEGGSLDAHRRAVELVPAEPPSRARARVLARLAGSLLGVGRWAECRDVAVAAIDQAVRVGEPTEESLARNIHGSVLVALGDVDAGIDELRRSRELAEAAATGHPLLIAHHNLALNLLQADRFEEALAEGLAGLEAARRIGLERRFGVDLGALVGEVLLRLGRWDEASAALEAGRELDATGAGTTWLNAVAGRLAALRGDAEAADALFSAIDAEGLDADLAAEASAARAEWAILAGRAGDASAAVAAGLAALAGLDDILWTAPLLALGLRAAADAGATDIEALEVRLAELGDRTMVGTSAAWLASARAERARPGGEDASAAWAAAAAAWAAVPDAYREAEASFRWAEAELRRQGVGADVRGRLEAAHGTAIRLGARPLAAAIERLARRARVRLPGVTVEAAEPATLPGGPIAGLSSRELEVLGLVVAGLSNGEIGERLFISRKTAAVHVTHILDKLGVSNRVEAAMLAERAGWRG